MPAIDDPGFVLRINALFGRRTMFLMALDREPLPVFCGNYVPDPVLAPRIAHWRDYLSADGHYNETQGILAGPIEARPGKAVTLPYQSLDYATARALREAGQAPPVLSVGTIGVCLERRALYVHRRESGAPSNAGLLHSFSGGYRVDEAEGVVAEGLREFAEETGLGKVDLVPCAPAPRLALFRDNDYGALETCLLGVPLTADQVGRMVPTAEGHAQEITFDALPGSLLDGKDAWTEGGTLEVLTWLAFGAPPCAAQERFAGMTAESLIIQATTSTNRR